jgi:hypothetical protein
MNTQQIFQIMKEQRFPLLILLMVILIVALSLPSCTPDLTPESDVPSDAGIAGLAVNAPQEQPADSAEPVDQSVNILIYENVYGAVDAFDRPLDMRVEASLDILDIPNANVVNVRENVTEFLIQLKSATAWDLVIVASESRAQILGGDVWAAVADEVTEHDTALIVEVWYLDQISYGRVEPFMNECGLELQRSQERNLDSAIADYIIYAVEEDHPVFRNPQVLSGMITPVGDFAWHGDIGDLMQLNGSGDARILASLQPEMDDSYGVIAECMNGQVIFQTLSTHDYSYTDSTALWQNYITYTLSNHLGQ